MKPAAPVIRIGPLDVNACPQTLWSDRTDLSPTACDRVRNSSSRSRTCAFYGRPSTNSTIRLSPTSRHRSLGASSCKGWHGQVRQQRIEPVDLSPCEPVIPPLRNEGRLVYASIRSIIAAWGRCGRSRPGSRPVSDSGNPIPSRCLYASATRDRTHPRRMRFRDMTRMRIQFPW